MWHVCERRGVHVGFWWEGQKERDHLEEVHVGGSIILKWIRMGRYGLN
jgi:hypothetical protein